MHINDALAIKKESEDFIMRRPNVVGMGVGWKNNDPRQGLALSAHVITKKPRGLKKGHVSRFQAVPQSIDGLNTDVIQTGHYKALAPTDRFRPAPGGVSIGHYLVTAGTLGMWVNGGNNPYYKMILSNNHVLANENDAMEGDFILQPGKYDGGTLTHDKIATLFKYVPIVFEGEESDCDAMNMIARAVNFCSRKLGKKSELRTYVAQAASNTVDCALADPIDETDILDEMIDGTKVSGWTELDLGDYVHKYGRTTGHTEGDIRQISVTATIAYGPGKMARFTDQVMAGNMSAGGDSGSIILTKDNKAGGLLFAGSDSTTIINRIENVIRALGITI